MDGGQPTGADPCSWPRVDLGSIRWYAPLTARPVPDREPARASIAVHLSLIWTVTRRVGGGVVSVAESVLAPPGPIPNPVVTQCSAGEYCGGDPVGGEAAADTTPLAHTHRVAVVIFPSPHLWHAAGWSSGSSLGS